MCPMYQQRWFAEVEILLSSANEDIWVQWDYYQRANLLYLLLASSKPMTGSTVIPDKIHHSMKYHKYPLPFHDQKLLKIPAKMRMHIYVCWMVKFFGAKAV